MSRRFSKFSLEKLTLTWSFKVDDEKLNPELIKTGVLVFDGNHSFLCPFWSLYFDRILSFTPQANGNPGSISFISSLRVGR